MRRFDESQFKSRVNAALQRVKTILDTSRSPQLPNDVPHEYVDKYAAVEAAANTLLAAQLHALELLGVTQSRLSTLKEWSRKRSVSLRFSAEEECHYLREAEREEESATKHVSTSTVFGTSKSFTVTKITEYFFSLDVKYRLIAFEGSHPDSNFELMSRGSTPFDPEKLPQERKDPSHKHTLKLVHDPYGHNDENKGYICDVCRLPGGTLWAYHCKECGFDLHPSCDGAHQCFFVIKSRSPDHPYPQKTVRPNIDVNMTWLLQNIGDDLKPNFRIDRSLDSTRTPRRNAAVNDALSALAPIYAWAQSVANFFTGVMFPKQTGHAYDLSAINDGTIFSPVLPLFETPGDKEKKERKEKKEKEAKEPKKDDKDEKKKEKKKSSRDKAIVPAELGSGVIRHEDVPAFLAEQRKSLQEKFATLREVLPDPSTRQIITSKEATAVVTLLHLSALCQHFADAVDFVEDMMRKQLVAAIGKEVGAVDFTNYMRFHARKLFKAQYQPMPFSYAIRRPNHYPEGVLSIEAQLDDGSLPDPITTTVAYAEHGAPMSFAINAAAKVSFGGERFLHGWVQQSFSGSSGSSLSLVARARQFSSFIVMVGRIVSAKEFEPKYGIIVENKDELKLPLLLETIPTPKEFRDAIESLSPEQQRFAKAFRAMQLESTLFGVLVIQIKPALEKLLRLPDDSLTKEIALTQDLLNLFIEYQTPSDLVSYDGEANASVASKVATVQEYVGRMQAMIKASKAKQLQQAQQEQSFRIAEDESLLLESVQTQSYGYAALSDSGLDMMEMKKSDDAPVMMKKARRMAAPARPSSSSVAMVDSKPVPKPAGGKPAPPQKSVAPAASTPAQPSSQPQSQPQPSEKVLPQSGSAGGSAGAVSAPAVDYTKIPSELEQKFDELDVDSALRPTIIKTGDYWTKRFQKSLLSEPETTSLGVDEQGKERNKAFDLLDALTKSGALGIDDAALHVVIASTHCFDKSLMDTVIQDNINPIEKVERSSLIVASTIHAVDPLDLINADQAERVATYSPMLIKGAGEDEDDDEDD